MTRASILLAAGALLLSGDGTGLLRARLADLGGGRGHGVHDREAARGQPIGQKRTDVPVIPARRIERGNTDKLLRERDQLPFPRGDGGKQTIGKRGGRSIMTGHPATVVPEKPPRNRGIGGFRMRDILSPWQRF